MRINTSLILTMVFFLSVVRPAWSEVSSFSCPIPGDEKPLKLVIDPEKRAVLQNDKSGSIALVSGSVVHYFLRYAGLSRAAKIDLSTGRLDIAVSKVFPEAGYEHIHLDCERK